MNYLNQILDTLSEPGRLEELYQDALRRGEAHDFNSAIQAAYQQAPYDRLLAAWYYRLQAVPVPPLTQPSRAEVWRLALPFALLSGLILGYIFYIMGSFLNHLPYFAFLWAPATAAVAILFLAAVAKKGYRRAILCIGLLAIAALYVLLIAPTQRTWHAFPYLDQMAIHLPLLAWIAIGLTLLGLRSLIKDRFSFLIKSLEAIITAGLYLIAGIAFGVITIGLLQALSIKLPDRLVIFLAGGGIGLIAIIALASIYDPRLPPGEQDFSQGLSKFIAQMMRLLLPLTLVVLIVYALLIPFNFLEPFRNRDVLIVYNVMLFAIMGLLLGATPIRTDDLTPRLLSSLRLAILAVAGLAILVSLYAFSAILYRTFNDTLTMNRLIIIGWNMINTTILGFLFYRVWKEKSESWVENAQAVFGRSMLAYVIWDLFVIFAIPLLFR